MGKNAIITTAAAGLELPPDLINGGVRLTLLGQEWLEIINHRGIIIYQSETITISLKHGRLILSGSNLSLAQLNEEQITIEGHIDSLSFQEDEDES